MAAPTQWTWVWTNSRRWWSTGKPAVLRSMESRRIRQDWAREQDAFYWNTLCLQDQIKSFLPGTLEVSKKLRKKSQKKLHSIRFHSFIGYTGVNPDTSPKAKIISHSKSKQSPGSEWSFSRKKVALVVKNQPANTGDTRDAGWVPGWEDPLK